MARESRSERNKKYIREELLREIDAGTKYIETTLLKRYWYVGPVMRVVYRTQMPQARRRLVNAADVILEYSDQLLNRDAYEKYLQQNEAWIRRKTGHKKEGELRKTIESTFELRVDWAKKLVQAEGNSYDDLVRNTMTRVEARKVAEEQIDMEKKNSSRPWN